MGWLEGLLSGYSDRHQAIQAENLALDQQAQQREQMIYEKLLEHENPEIADMAAAGILGLGQPRKRKSGFAGWMGEMQSSPQLAAIQRFRQTMQPSGEELTVPRQPSIPAVSGALPAPPSVAGSAALSSTSPVTGGAVQPVTPPPAPPPPASAPPGTDGPYAGMTGSVSAGGPPSPWAGMVGLGGRTAEPPPPGMIAEGLGPTVPGTPVPPPPTLPFAPPRPPGQVSPGLSGATTQTVGRQAPPPRRRTTLFPTTEDIKRRSVRAEIEGTIEGYTDMYRSMGVPEIDARRQAAELYEDTHIRAGAGGTPYTPMEFDVTDPATGQTERVYGWLERRTGQQLDAQKRPLVGQVSKAVPYSAVSGDVYFKEAAQQLGYHPGDVARDPVKARQVGTLADELAGRRAAVTTTQRGEAAADVSLNRQQVFTGTMALRQDWNDVSVKVREQASAVAQMQTAMIQAKQKGNLAAGAEAMTVLFQKALDPGSVVRETEARRPAEFAGLTNRIQGAWDRLRLGGAPITLAELEKYRVLAEEMQRAAAVRLEDERARIARLATKNGMDPNDIVPASIEALMPVRAPDGTTGGGAGGGSPAAPVTGAATGAPAGRRGAVKNPQTGKWEYPD